MPEIIIRTAEAEVVAKIDAAEYNLKLTSHALDLLNTIINDVNLALVREDEERIARDGEDEVKKHLL